MYCNIPCQNPKGPICVWALQKMWNFGLAWKTVPVCTFPEPLWTPWHVGSRRGVAQFLKAQVQHPESLWQRILLMPVVVFHGIALMYHLIGQRPFGIFYHNLGLLKMKKKDQPSLSIRFTSITEDFLTLKKYALSGLIRIITNGSVTFVSSGKIMLILVHRFMSTLYDLNRRIQAFPGTVATVIVHQNIIEDRNAGLTTAVYVTDPDTHFHDRAHSLEPLCLPADILRLSGAEETCARRAQDGHGTCSGHHQLPPLHPHVPVQTFHGQGFHVRVPSTLSIAEAEENLEARISRRSQRREGPYSTATAGVNDPERTPAEDVPEDTSSFMARNQALLLRQARQDRTNEPSSSSSYGSMSTTSSRTSTTDQRQTVLVLLNGRTISTLISWNRPDALHASVAQACDVRVDQIHELHHVSHRPADLRQVGLECLLVQTTGDFPISPFLRLVLIDIEFYGTEELQPFAFRRLTKWLPHIINRRSIFRMVELDEQ